MGLRAKDVVLSASAQATLSRLESSATYPREKSIAKRVRQLGPTLREDCLHGEVVRKRFLPRSLVEKYRIGNLYVEDLPDFWRLLYAITHAGSERFVIVLEILDHKAYDSLFPGRGR
ncbi:MAG: hypothetical protein KGJ23_13605 [Euryarchaeota archaeon]|nr:hypothetical protein [Euryarchaeota archaeon]MDE1837633.1 hypothetical protein [Euryarchaeota archaeon]MDE1880825.1 hypothetical protein [Euryarchaeota archaeon]MDE2045936.1 hypothetical protein [Thermoplasmata archaeon]